MESDDKQDFNLAEPILEPIQKTMKPTLAGILLIVVAFFTIFISATLVTIDESTVDEII